MTKNLARIDAFRRRVRPETAPAHRNDNRPSRHFAAVAKPVAGGRLTSHWRTVGGRLECYWQIESAEETSAEAPGPSCMESMRWRLVGGRPGFAGPRAPAVRITAA
jgi:hypothetical protein